MVVYFPSLPNDFIFDDRSLTIENETVVHPSVDMLFSYRPVRNLSYAFDYLVFGDNPAGFRFMNIVYHTLTTFLVFFWVKAFSREPFSALVAAAIYALHPVQTDAVAYISGRRDILAALFGMMALILFVRFLRGGARRFLLLSIIAMVFSFLSKENGAVVPVLMVGILLLEGRRIPLERKRPLLLLFLPLLVLAVVGGIWGGGSPLVSGGTVLFHGNSPRTHYLTALTLFPYYLKQTLFPFQLILDNAGYQLVQDLDPKVFCSVITLLLYASLTVLLWYKRYYRLAFYLIFFVVALAPMLQIVPLHEIAADHYLYFPLIGFCAFVGETSVVAWKNLSHKRYKVLAGMGAIILLVAYPWYVYRTSTRIRELTNIYTALAADSKWRPLSFRGLYTVGAFFLENGFPDVAYRYYRSALQTGYYDSSLLGNLVLYHIVKGEHNKAIALYEEYDRRGEPVSLSAFAEMAIVYLIQGDCDRARRTLARLAPGYDVPKHHEVVASCDVFKNFDPWARISFLRERGFVIETRPLYENLIETDRRAQEEYLWIMASYDVPVAARFVEEKEEKDSWEIVKDRLRKKKQGISHFCDWFSRSSGNRICMEERGLE